MRNGFSVPILVIVIFLFVLAPVGFYFLINSQGLNKVRGAEARARQSGGAVFIVNSTQGTWDMYEYLCKTMAECERTLTSGALAGQISGGVASDHEVFISRDARWSEYNFLKVFVSHGWGTPERSYSVTHNRGEVKDLLDGGKSTQVLIVPLDQLNDQSLTEVATFTD